VALFCKECAREILNFGRTHPLTGGAAKPQPRSALSAPNQNPPFQNSRPQNRRPHRLAASPAAAPIYQNRWPIPLSYTNLFFNSLLHPPLPLFLPSVCATRETTPKPSPYGCRLPRLGHRGARRRRSRQAHRWGVARTGGGLRRALTPRPTF
jgi:hypothetical protein